MFNTYTGISGFRGVTPKAGVTQHAGIEDRNASVLVPLDLASAVIDIDATQADSVNGGQELFNLIASPPVAGLFDFWNGTSGASQAGFDLTFTGSAGSSSAYFNADTGSITRGFYIQAANAAAQPDFILDFHKSTEGQKGWIGMAFRSAPTLTNNTALFGNENSVNGHGFAVYYSTTAETLRLQIGDGDGAAVNFTWMQKLENSTDYLVLISLSHTGGNTTATLYLNSIHGWSITNAVSTTTDATGQMTFMNDDSVSNCPVDSRFYWAGMGNDELSTDDVELIGETLATRHSRTYILDTNDALASDPLLSVANITIDMHLCAALSTSWAGGQTISSTQASPSVGTQANYEFWLGSDGTEDTNQPRMVGTFGTPGAGWKWQDGDECLRQKAAAGLLMKAHRTDQTGFTIGFLFTTPAAALTGTETLYQNYVSGSTGGISIFYAADERIDYSTYNGSSFVTASDITGILASSKTYLLIISTNPSATTSNIQTWLYDDTGLIIDTTGNINLADTTTDSTGVANIGGTVAAPGIGDDLIIRDVFASPTFTTSDTVANAIRDVMEDLHGVDLTA